MTDKKQPEKPADPLEAALETVNQNQELHKGPEDKVVREANANNAPEGEDPGITADDSGE